MISIYQGDNLEVLASLADHRFDLVYTDPPFNTGRTQQIHGKSYVDSFKDYLGFLRPRLRLIYDLLSITGTLYLHLDYHQVHYVKILLDEIFGVDRFLNEIIWAYDFGGRAKTCWPKKHDNILVYTKSSNYTFNFDQMDKIPYMAPGWHDEKRAKEGKTPTDVWWNTIVHTNGKERLNYPTQKPILIAERIVKISSNPGDLVLDPFAGTGTVGEACKKLGRDCILIDNNPQAIEIMHRRLD